MFFSSVLALFPVVCFLLSVSCFLFPAVCACFLFPVLCFLYPVSCFLFPQCRLQSTQPTVNFLTSKIFLKLFTRLIFNFFYTFGYFGIIFVRTFLMSCVEIINRDLKSHVFLLFRLISWCMGRSMKDLGQNGLIKFSNLKINETIFYKFFIIML